MSEQPALGAHYCTGCGQMHGAETADYTLDIARLESETRIRLAEIERGQERRTMDIVAATEVAVAEIHAEAGIAETEALAGGIAESGEPAPVIVDAPAQDIEPEVTASIEPRDEDESGPPAEPKKPGLSYWP